MLYAFHIFMKYVLHFAASNDFLYGYVKEEGGTALSAYPCKIMVLTDWLE
jgi:hypothetical protein